MTQRTKFWIVTTLGGLCALLILTNLTLALLNSRLSRSLQVSQTRVTRAQNLQGTLQNLVSRVAQEAERDVALRNVLVRHQFLLADPVRETNAAPEIE